MILAGMAAALVLAQAPKLPGRIELTCVDEEAIGYATFQSHNQKVVENRHGLFMTHLRTRNEPYTAQTWRLSRSTDGGKSFTTLFEAVNATNPPALETDSAGTVYLFRPDFLDNAAYLYRFTAAKQFRDPGITRIPNGAAGKYAACLDEKRRRIYWFAHNNTFHILSLDGKLLESKTLLRDGPDAALQYPHLFLDRRGRIHAAWTTQRHNVYLYWDIHHMVSEDGGETWRTLDGKRLEIPVVADQHGPATRITAHDEYEAHTWLSSFTVNRGAVVFLYEAQTSPARERVVRFDSETGARQPESGFELRGETIKILGLDGFFAVRPGANGDIYCVGNDSGRLACLVSRDDGKTWHDYARTDATYNLYAIGGCRTLSPRGEVIGSFTDQKGDNLKGDRGSKVYFFRIRAAR